MTHRTTFGAWTVDFAANRLSRNGQEAVLDPQAMDVLATLLKADGETVSADELLEQVWGARQVEPNAIHGAIHRIRQALGDSAREPRYIATVPKRGYRTVAAIESAATVEQPPDENARWLRRAAIALIVALPLCAPLVWRSADRPLAAQAAKSAEHSPPSLAVLPFTSAEEREDLNFLGHGLASALLSELVRIPELRVIAQNSSFSSQLEQLTSEEVAERLSVSYVLQGQLAKHQDLYRLGLTLVDARRNAVVWADAFSGALIDLNRVDKTVVPKVLAALNVRATAAEFSNESHVGGTTFAAYARAHYLLGLGDYSRTDHLDEAQRQLDISLTEAPDFVPALLAKARLLLQRWRAGVDDRDTSQDRESLVSQALVIDPEHPVALAYRAWSLFNRRGGDYPTAARYYERSFSIDPTNTESLRGLCTFYLTLNEYGRAAKVAEYLVDRDPLCVICNTHLAFAYEMLERYEAAEEQYRNAYGISGINSRTVFRHGLVLLQKGDTAQAARKFESLKADSPEQLTGLAMAHYAQGNQAQYASLKTRIHRLNPRHAVAEAFLLAAEGKLQESIARFRQAVDANSVAVRQPMWNPETLWTSLGWRRPRPAFDLAQFNPRMPWDP